MFWTSDSWLLPVDHVALETDKYHISFVSTCIEGICSISTIIDAAGFPSIENYTNVHSSIRYHLDADLSKHQQVEPSKHRLPIVSNKAINEVYGKALDFNKIHPESVTIHRGQRVLDRNMEPIVNLNKTKYSIIPTST
jgi:hypothetical protein